MNTLISYLLCLLSSSLSSQQTFIKCQPHAVPGTEADANMRICKVWMMVSTLSSYWIYCLPDKDTLQKTLYWQYLITVKLEQRKEDMTREGFEANGAIQDLSSTAMCMWAQGVHKQVFTALAASHQEKTG